MSKTRYLNGWQRLWVLVVVTYMLLLSLIIYNRFPDQDQIKSEEVYELLECIKENNPAFQKNNIFDLKKSYADVRDEALIKILNEKFTGTLSGNCIIKVNAKYSTNFLFDRQLDFTKDIFLAWLLPSVSLYLLGAIIGWVRRGFAKN